MMFEIIVREFPLDALPTVFMELGAFTDCYTVDICKTVTLTQYIEAFYTTPLFKVERSLLSLATFKRAKDSEAVDLALAKTKHYSIWTVEQRVSDQILLCDFSLHTKSWLKVEPIVIQGEPATRLYFGSVVMPKEVSESGEATFGFVFHLLGKFHNLYSKALLNAAYKKLFNSMVNC